MLAFLPLNDKIPENPESPVDLVDDLLRILYLIGWQMTSCEEFLNELSSYVLGDLDDEICNHFRKHLDGCPSCRKESMEMQEALNLLPTGLPTVPLPAGMKRRVHDRIDSLRSLPAAGLFNIDALKWEESGISGVRFHWLRKDDSGATVALLRILPGHTFPNHRHVGAEDCLVLQGGFRDSRGVYEPGDYVHYDAGSIQEGLKALEDEDCVLFVVNQQGIEFVG